MSFNTGFTKLFKEYGIKHPIVQAPMAKVVNAKLTSEVRLAGGLGFLQAAYLSYEDFEKELKTAHELLKSHIDPTNGNLPIGIGFMTFTLDSQSSLPFLHLSLSYKPLAIWFSFGDFSKYVMEIRSLSPNTKIFAQVQTIEQAIFAYNNEADVIVVQGNESGGHGLMNNSSNSTLLPETVDKLNQIYSSRDINDEKLKRPIVLAAGGISDGRGLASTLMLGGDGVVMGTRFVVSKESSYHQNAKQCIIDTNDGGKNTVRTQIFDKLQEKNIWSSQWDGRAIKNKTVEEGEKLADDENGISERKRIFKEATLEHDYSRAVIYAGTGIGLIHNELSVKEIVETTVKLALETVERVYHSML
ncbi:16872_t:CDS:2 [Funneliformis geosporum]|uniref:10580_t:CDS:1 n=1 Tax=Funneliformis geosporum TaxID=1117311 RepID=A0A9W4WZM7_9GLOM|nr:10580_t:CDS:2 [Funneliformis geosporum]CAI2186812.1 16872_t:CDS:2 [Funneliformis geosporum]